MMMPRETWKCEFDAIGEPKGQPRPRAFSIKGTVRVYDPGTAEGWKSCVAAAAQSHRPESPLEGAVDVYLGFTMPRPQSHYRTGKHAGELKPTAPMYHCAKPDADNLAKAVLDALTMLGFWRDDSQIAQLMVDKRYAYPKGPDIGVFIAIRSLAYFDWGVIVNSTVIRDASELVKDSK